MTCSKDQKVTTMVLKVDLDCCQCYRKVKKVLCKFPQIRNQVFDEKNNTVTITVVCCGPEKIRDKICCKEGYYMGTNIPEESLPEPFNQKKRDLLLRSFEESSTSSRIQKFASVAESDTAQASHFSPSFRKHFFNGRLIQ